MTATKRGPLAGLRVLEIAGIGPGPFCGMLLADLGADVVVVDRLEAAADALDLGDTQIANRGKRSVAVDLKSADGVETVLGLVEHCDVLIEGMRPGVMERLGLAPDVCLARNSRLVYGRMTGWGQDGPLAHAAGHDLNYIALSGALWYAGQPGTAPLPPPSLVGDIGGGAMYLAVGILAGVMHARATGKGQVIDAAIVDGSAHMTTLLLALQASGQMTHERGESLLDGPHWYNTYRCADGGYVSVGSLEPKFHAQLLDKLGLSADPAFAKPYDRRTWPALRQRLAEHFATRTRDEWCALLEGTDACFAPVLSPDEAAAHPHMRQREIYTRENGVLQASPAPRFSATPPGPPGAIPRRGQHTEAVLRDWARASHPDNTKESR
ncbi:CaiB/BaiF CoA-transferase family protein [Caballeronia sp. LZ062]|uniref:CaiB/BaiF CoA transferase family protein n=1 Tax=unclassified Caballeronia TaxID=2646786 RepID=UPI0028588B58|nr:MULTISPECIES: CaiB/BaiF CoA-transferase family protein [unclassified Caballeronia]MDR5855349.1 CaiB/BaiF CoA-transferase family protein [Caballeronia sp. LZ050]MDR5870122.1 CaiB/BaiF CoA-transferase family protein [Caballeronia sp. LZ062]